MIAALSLAFVWQETASDRELGPRDDGGREVLAVAPDRPGPIAPDTPFVRIGDRKYVVHPDGALGPAFLVDGGWGDVVEAARRPGPAGEPAVWRAKVFLFTRSEIYERGRDGFWRMRRSSIDRRDREAIDRELALFAALVETASGGALRVRFDVTVDEDPVRAIREGGRWVDPPLTLEDVLPLVNREPWDDESRVDRGPYDSVFVLTADLAEPSDRRIIPFFLPPAAGEPGGLARELARLWAEDLARNAAAAGWRVGPASGATPGPGGVPDPGIGPDHEIWASVTSARRADDATWRARRYGPDPQGSPLLADPRDLPEEWREAASRALEALASRPHYGALTVDAGPAGTLIVARASHRAALAESLDEACRPLGTTLEGYGFWGVPDRDERLVNLLRPRVRVRQEEPGVFAIRTPDLQDQEVEIGPGEEAYLSGGVLASPRRLVSLRIGSERKWVALPGATLLDVPSAVSMGASGAVRIPVRLAAALGAEPPPATRIEWTVGGSFPPQSLPVGLRFVEGIAQTTAVVATSGQEDELALEVLGERKVVRTVPAALVESPLGEGAFSVARETDPAEGPMLVVTERGAHRNGAARLFHRDPPEPLFDRSTWSGLRFRLRTDSDLPYELVFVEDGGQEWTVPLVAPPPWPADWESEPPRRAHPAPRGEWTTIVVHFPDTREAHPVRSVFLRAPRSSLFFERGGIEPSRTEFAQWELLGPNPPPSTEREVTPTIPPALARLAPFTNRAAPLGPEEARTLVALLGEAGELLRLNALAVLDERGVSAPVEALAKEARSANAMIAALALRLLAQRDEPAAALAIREAADIGPFDHNRLYAARVLGASADPRRAVPISSLLTARSWRARREAARILANLEGEPAAIMAVSFLLDADPRVRLAVVEGARTDLELVNRRLLWTSVNDPSERLRAAAAWRLARGSDPEYQSQALEALRDESNAVRQDLLERMERDRDVRWIPAARRAMEDASAAVRAAAVRAYFACATEPSPYDLAPVSADPDPRVQRALLEAARAARFSLPESARAAMRSSPDPWIRREVESE